MLNLKSTCFILVILILLPASYSPANGEDEIIKFAETVNKDIDDRFTIKGKSFYTSFDYAVNQDDAMAGIKLGFLMSSKYNIYFNLFFSVRPYKKSVDDPHTKEERNLMGVGLDKFFFISYGFGFYAYGGLGYTSNKYAGIVWERSDGLAPLGGSGIFYYIFDYVYLRLGYQYMSMPNVGDHRGQVSIDFSF